MPNGSFQLSPWTDLTVSGPSVDGNHGKDLWFTRKHLEMWARYYVGQADPRSPYVSPVFADLSGLPPLLLLVGEDELLLDDTLRVRDAGTSVGTDVRVLIGKGMQHDWPLTLPWLDESNMRGRRFDALLKNTSPLKQCSTAQSMRRQPPAPRPAMVSARCLLGTLILPT